MKSDPVSPLESKEGLDDGREVCQKKDMKESGKVQEQEPKPEEADEAKQEDDDPKCFPCEEAEVQAAVKAPAMPSAKEIEEHNLTHFLYRSWCDLCIKGRGKDEQHRPVK